ncbi:hypothetical protein STCU_04235 [Strigomonas culicis]|uniref:Uncharacterized protein n=1 Tax=Strigomonas culicis TaxID=28005 RepID=S9UH56_9TRYP|nr:hypothetical protein STCU_04235 [Strigomonas culicis]|eukprot:EPY30102.1 hypothetical protein STCU_04235 [Strigomonas culicis]
MFRHRALRLAVVASNATRISTDGSLRPPYATDGGSIPVYSMVHGLIQKRFWVFRNASWCDLCKEPVALWVNHMGRKDHALMDQHYSALVEFPRRWNPEALLGGFAAALGVDIGAYQRHYAHVDHARRVELYAMLRELEREGMLFFGDPRQTFLARQQGGLRGLDHQGALVLHRYLMGPFMRLYPDGHIQDYSNLLDFVSCSYNMETVYDLCAMHTLDTIAIKSNIRPSSPVAMGLGGAAASASAGSGFEQQAVAGAEERSKEEEAEAFSRKAVFVRQIMGQLRWLTLPEQAHPAGYTFPPYTITLGEICLKALIVEIIMARLCEYMVRAEPVWRDFGYERKRIDARQMGDGADVLPTPIHYAYRPMSPKMDDLYSTHEGKMEEELRQTMRRKEILIPEALRAQRE